MENKPEELKNKLKELEKSMQKSTFELMKYDNDSKMYEKALSTLATQYEEFDRLYNLADEIENNTLFYFVEYVDLSEIKDLLLKNGYLKQPKTK